STFSNRLRFRPPPVCQSATLLRKPESPSMSIGTLENKPPRLVSDIGGTHARFALSTSVNDIRDVSVVKVADYPSIEDAIKDYLRLIGSPVIKHAAIGIANPIVSDHVKMTNFPWEFSIEATREACGFQT